MGEPLTLPPELAETHELVRELYKDSTQLHHEFIRRKSDKKADGFYRAFYPNGQLWCEEIYRDNRVWETIQDFMPDGRPLEGSGLKSGNGHLKVVSPEGQLTDEGNYQGGMKEGVWRSYHKNGQLSSEGCYTKHQQSGEWVYFFENGQEKSRGLIREGKKYGVWRFHDEHGNYIGEETYVEGKRHGADRTLYPDGKIKTEAFYENDQCVGTWKRYHPSGKLNSESDYEIAPIRGHSRIFDENTGALRKEGPLAYDEALKTWGWSGLWRGYESDGRILFMLYEYKNNEVKTLRTYFDPAPLQKILREEPPETQHQSMLAAMKGSSTELYKSLEVLVEQGEGLSVELAVMMALAAPQEALGRVSTLLLPHKKEALQRIQHQPKDQTDWPACAALILSLHSLQSEETIDESYDLCLGQALYWADQKKVATQELTGVLRKIPITRREELVFQKQPSQPLQDNRLLTSFASTCPTARVLEGLIQPTLAWQRYQFGNKQTRIMALASFGDMAVAPLEQAIGNTKKQYARYFLVEALAKTKSTAAAKTLFVYLGRKNAAIVNIAKEGLVSMGDPLLPTLETYILGKALGRSKHAAMILKAMPQTEASQKMLASLKNKAKGEARTILA